MNSNRKDIRKLQRGDTSLKDELKVEVKQASKEEALVTDIAVATTGNVDAGKSSLIGALITGILDDGNGSAREWVAVHDHEVIKGKGKTSEVSTRILKLADGRIATLIDLCGHEKYFSTTAYGITALMPDYGLSIISPSRGVLEMTTQHFMMLTNSNIPTAIIITKIDVAVENSCEQVEKNIVGDLCKSRKAQFLNSYADYWTYRRGRDLCNEYKIASDDDLGENEDNFKPEEMEDMKYFLNFDVVKHEMIQKMVSALQVPKGAR